MLPSASRGTAWIATLCIAAGMLAGAVAQVAEPDRAAPPAADSAVPFAFQQGDVVAVYGNGLADRMQHSPWVETVLQ